jgi:hypothetical protein
MLKHVKAASRIGLLTFLMTAPLCANAAAGPQGAVDFPDLFWSERMMMAMDTNKDGMVSRDEYMDYMGRQYDMMDTGKKKMLTKQQFMDKKMMRSTFPTSVSETGPR